jgi:VWFA-related protein
VNRRNQPGSPSSRRQFVLTAASLVCGRSLASAQDQPTFSADVKVVNVFATVHDKKGAIIRDLGKDDFTLLEDKRQQTVRYFARESDLPLTLGLMVDTSMSQQRVLVDERTACFRFLDQVLRENKDQVYVMQFDLTVRTRQDLTSSRKKLDDALAYVDTPTNRQLQNQYGGGTLLFDAVVSASQNIMKNQRGRKAMIVMSDGVDNGSDSTVANAIEAAQRADTLIYSILFSDDMAYGFLGGGREGKNALMQMSKETGAGFFEVSKRLPLERVFDLIEEELRSQYSIGYVSDVPVRISEFRTIQLTTRQKGLVVQARDRYWAQR